MREKHASKDFIESKLIVFGGDSASSELVSNFISLTRDWDAGVWLCIKPDRPECSNTEEMMSVDFLDMPVN